jgi:ACR3 family arsenite efflux pump ArsB
MKGNPTYTLTQVAVNDLILLVAYAPTVKLLAGTTDVSIPWETLLFSVAFFVLIPLILGVTIRWVIVKRKGVAYLEEHVLHRMKPFSMAFLLLTLVLIFIVSLLKCVVLWLPIFSTPNDVTVPSPNSHRKPRSHPCHCYPNYRANHLHLGADIPPCTLASFAL